VPAVITIVVRVWMPDRPGALGQVASRIGAVRGDVLSIEVLEQGGGRAIDELTVALPDQDLMPLLTAEIDAVDGVSVENIRVVDIDRTDPSLSALALGAAIAESRPEERLDVMIAGVQRFAETDWVESSPSDLLWGHMVTSELTIAAGRTANPIHERERVRFSLLVRLADALVSPRPVA